MLYDFILMTQVSIPHVCSYVYLFLMCTATQELRERGLQEAEYLETRHNC